MAFDTAEARRLMAQGLFITASLPDGDTSFDAVSSPIFLGLYPYDISGAESEEPAAEEGYAQLLHLRRTGVLG